MLWKTLETAIDDCSVEDQKKVVSSLLQWGCCGRCAMRFLCEKQQFIYRNTQEELVNALKEFLALDEKPTNNGTDSKGEDPGVESEQNSALNPTDSICITCLGILQQDICSESFLDKVYSQISAKDHEYKTFFCALTTPVNLILREHSIWVLLRELVPDVYTKDNEENIPTVKEVWKWCCGMSLGKRLRVSFDMKSPFEIDINLTHVDIGKECAFLFDVFPETFRKRKDMRGWEIFTRANVSKAILNAKDIVYKRNYCCPPLPPKELAVCEPIKCSHEPIYIAGRYNKYSRTLSQTPWLIDGKRKSESSVEEIINQPIHELVKSTESKFSSSGREDVDVKMLGRGRPFIVEIINPHRVVFTAEHMKALQEKINSSTDEISVRDIQEVTREDTLIMKDGETDKAKSYCALCWSREKITDESFTEVNQMKDIVLKQKTPIRVLHRRPYASRDRTIHSLHAKAVNDHYFVLDLVTQAGTYVKEFVHGDLGRTVPSLCSILNSDCDILELNVTEVLLDWPKTINYE